MEALEVNCVGASSNRLVRRLGEAFYGRKRGRVRALNDLAGAGLPVPDGVVLTKEAHEAFLEASGVLEGVKIGAWRGEEPLQKASEIRLRYGSTPVGAELNRAICQALIGLGAPVVIVLSDSYEQGSLRTIPDVLDAVREAWLSAEGLKWQIQNAALGEEIPTWPVLIQKEINPIYTGWSSVETAPVETPRVGGHSARSNVALYEVEPAGGEGPERKGITRLALEAASVLGDRPRILWGLEDAQWYVLSTEMREDENLVQGWFS